MSVAPFASSPRGVPGGPERPFNPATRLENQSPGPLFSVAHVRAYTLRRNRPGLLSIDGAFVRRAETLTDSNTGGLDGPNIG